MFFLSAVMTASAVVTPVSRSDWFLIELLSRSDNFSLSRNDSVSRSDIETVKASYRQSDSN